jgi:dolichol-phosphate mannosyltransferase
VRAAYDAVAGVFATVADRYDFEIVFTDNHSTDQTFSRISEIAKLDPRVRNRNYSQKIFNLYTPVHEIDVRLKAAT